MKILFVTDLHGAEWKYDRLYDIARADRPDAVINSGDMLPKGDNLYRQNDFITGKLSSHFAQFDDMGIPYFCYLGNDDLRIWDDLFEETCRRYACVHNIAQRKVAFQGIEFIGMNWVVDYPFRLKDRCRMDSGDYAFQPQFGAGLLSTPSGWETLPDWHGYARKLPTIADELKSLDLPDRMDNSVYVFHMPPNDLGLDVCINGQAVGSKAIYDFLAVNQPRLSFHGHIHESPEMSGAWKAPLGNTLCVQPGQLEDEFAYVTADLESMALERKVELDFFSMGW
ncbi:metallophosphoesterase [Desulfococcus sp.]|uniref:metallophosphoesterase family protein n=1 Tax=Desulfococcus sp. TaxID=2025834 RepID=UPI003593977E